MKTLIMGLLATLCTLIGCKTTAEGYKSLSVTDFEKAISNKNVVRLDVRTAEEFAEGHIANAINIDVLKSDFESNALKVLPKDKTIAVNCRSGKRSKNAAAILAKHGYKIIELDPGYNGWVSAGKPVTKQ